MASGRDALCWRPGAGSAAYGSGKECYPRLIDHLERWCEVSLSFSVDNSGTDSR